jgi:hypothetical protein
MRHQASPLEQIQHPRTPHLPFEKRVGFQILCVLPDTVLNNTPLADPETGVRSSLREESSFQGLCYVRVRNPTTAADGHYWADVWADANVAASADPTVDASSDPTADAHVVLTEEDLNFALACDVRLEHMDPAQILRLMQAHARELAPLQSRTKSLPVAAPLPAPSVDPSANQNEAVQQYTVVLTENDLQEVVPPGYPDVSSASEPLTAGSLSCTHITPVAPYIIQQALLRTMLKMLKRQLAQTRDRARALELKASYALVARVQYWQRRTCRRVLYVEECRWSFVRQCWVWHLMLEIPKSLMRGPFAHAAAA